MSNNRFYRDHYHHLIFGLMFCIVLMIVIVSAVLYQLFHRPLPIFHAIDPKNQQLLLTAYDEPDFLPHTILTWASTAATVAYTFDFVNYNKQIAAARPYFTQNGWRGYESSVTPLITRVVQNQLFVNGVVAGAPVIANQGALPGQDYVWRVEIPFLVTYQSANITEKHAYYVVMTIVRVPTQINPQGIGIDEFIMR